MRSSISRWWPTSMIEQSGVPSARILRSRPSRRADFLDRFLRRAQADPLQRPPGQSFESFERERQMRAAFILRYRVDFIDDQSFGALEKLPAARRSEQNIKRLGRGDQDVRRPAHIAWRSCAGVSPERTATRIVGRRIPSRPASSIHFREGRLQIFRDIVAERLERRDVNHARALVAARRQARV